MEGLPGGLARASGRAPIRTDASTGAITIAEPDSRWHAAFSALAAALFLGLTVGQAGWKWLTRGHMPLAVTCLLIAAGALTWGCSRAWRVALRLGDDGITVRNFYRTYRISWPEVRCFADGSVSVGESMQWWALNIGLHDGRVVTAAGTSRGKRGARPETLAAIRQAAERYGIPAELTGTLAKRGSRRSRAAAAGARNGTVWSPAAPVTCLECGAETTGATGECARCGAPLARQRPVAAAPAAGGPGSSVASPAEDTPGWTPGQQASTGNSHRGALIVAGVGGVALVVGLIAAIGLWATSTSPTNQLTWDQLQPGDCLAGSNMSLDNSNPWPEYVTRVACPQRHEAEVFFAGKIWPQSLAYPGKDAVDEQAYARCTAAFTAYDGLGPGGAESDGDGPQSLFSFNDIADDDSADWASGMRSLVCVAYEPSSADGPSAATPVDYSIKGSNKLRGAGRRAVPYPGSAGRSPAFS